MINGLKDFVQRLNGLTYYFVLRVSRHFSLTSYEIFTKRRDGVIVKILSADVFYSSFFPKTRTILSEYIIAEFRISRTPGLSLLTGCLLQRCRTLVLMTQSRSSWFSPAVNTNVKAFCEAIIVHSQTEIYIVKFSKHWKQIFLDIQTNPSTTFSADCKVFGRRPDARSSRRLWSQGVLQIAWTKISEASWRSVDPPVSPKAS